MSIKRYTAIKDNSITDAYQADLITRGTGSNMGAADSVEVFSIYAQASTSSLSSSEKARTLAWFPVLTSDEAGGITSIARDRTNAIIPASGSVDFYLNLYNVVTDQTLPRNFTLVVSPVSQSWQEGVGYDLDNFKDLTYDGTGSNWIMAEAHTPWVDDYGTAAEGGSFLSASWSGNPLSIYDEYNYTASFDGGTENLSVNITGLVEKWLAAGYSNYGVGIHLTSSQENSQVRSYYTKRFSARSSEFYFKRPHIEARWDSSRKDNRGNFYVSSSVLSSADNKGNLYIYNYVRGQLKNFYHPAGEVTGAVFVTAWTSGSGGEQLTTTPQYPVTGGYVSTGIYSASFALSTTASAVYDRWHSGSHNDDHTGQLSTGLHTGSFLPQDFKTSNYYTTPQYVTAITNLKDKYHFNELGRFRLYTRLRNWAPTIYTVASQQIEVEIVEDAYYKVYRVVDDYNVVNYGTGSLNSTRLSYDATGSYFDFDMSMLESGYSYGIKFVYYLNGSYQEQPENFKFRVEDFNISV
jgi:hypothetical protein